MRLFRAEPIESAGGVVAGAVAMVLWYNHKIQSDIVCKDGKTTAEQETTMAWRFGSERFSAVPGRT